MFKPIGLGALAVTLLAGSATGALALDATDFADTLFANGKLLGWTADYGSASAEGDTVTVSSFTFYGVDIEPIEVPGELVFEGVTETEDGYTAARAILADIDFESEVDDVSILFSNLMVEDITLLADPKPSDAAALSTNFYRRISAGPLVIVQGNGNELFAIEAMEASVEPSEDGTVESYGEMSGIRADFSKLPEIEVKEALSALGLETFSGSIVVGGNWNIETGRMNISPYTIALDDLGTLEMGFEIEGYDEALLTSLAKSNAKFVELAQSGLDLSPLQQTELSFKVVQSMAGIAIDEGGIRYEDHSLVNKILDFVAEEQGIDRKALIEGMKFMIPMSLADVKADAFKSMLTDALVAFLSDPQSITFEMAPENPVSFADVMDMQDEIDADPTVLIDLLNLQVTAND